MPKNLPSTPEQIITSNINPKDTVVIAVSGGPDSVYLLNLCLEISAKHPFKIIVAHANHKLRGKESDSDQSFVKKLAELHNLPFETTNLNIPKKGNLEDNARRLRYSFLENIRAKHKASWIITAHHLNDNIETSLFNLIRGSYLNGLTGMETASPENSILRPLLNISKAEIINHLKKEKIRFRIDRSNFDPRFSRNLIRSNIVPEIKKINPSFEKTYLENLELLKETNQYLLTQVKEFVATARFQLDEFLKQPAILQKNILNHLFLKTNRSPEGFNRRHLAQIMQMLSKKQCGLKKEFGKNHFITVKKEGGKRIIAIL